MSNVIGYARVSTREQNPQSQERALVEAGCERVFVDGCPLWLVVHKSSECLSRPPRG